MNDTEQKLTECGKIIANNYQTILKLNNCLKSDGDCKNKEYDYFFNEIIKPSFRNIIEMNCYPIDNKTTKQLCNNYLSLKNKNLGLCDLIIVLKPLNNSLNKTVYLIIECHQIDQYSQKSNLSKPLERMNDQINRKFHYSINHNKYKLENGSEVMEDLNNRNKKENKNREMIRLSINELKQLCETWDKTVNQSEELIDALKRNNRKNPNSKIDSLNNCHSISKGISEKTISTNNYEPVYCKLFVIPRKKDYYNKVNDFIIYNIKHFLSLSNP